MIRVPPRTAAVCAFSLAFHITQRDGRQGRDVPGSRTVAPSCTRLPGPHRLTLWVPIIHPCWSGSMPVLVEGAPEPVPSADIQLRDPLRIGNRLR